MSKPRPNDETFGQTLRRLREAAGLSRRKLGYLIDRSEGAIRNWETDADVPKLDSLQGLVEHLGPEILVAAFRQQLQSLEATMEIVLPDPVGAGSPTRVWFNGRTQASQA